MQDLNGHSTSNLAIRCALISRGWRKALDTAFTKLSLTDSTWAPLMHLDYGDGISQKELAQRVGIEPCTIVRGLDALEERGLIERKADVADRRTRKVFLSASGIAVLKEMKAAQATVDRQILENFAESELFMLGEMFRKLELSLST